ncbi:MAG: crotonase [Pelagibacterium sp. SCN 64-44]|nr:MAG: crotonase [Pelagibacterium sp. SCN 64-44]
MTQLSDYANKFENIRFQRDGGVLEVTFHTENGPLQWGLGPHREFEQAFLDIGRDRENEVVILTGTGSHFSGPTVLPGGHPRKTALTPSDYDLVYWEGKHVLVNLLNIEVPVISAINGPATRHCEIPLLSDIVIASEDCYFHDSAHFSGGMVPGDGMHIVLPLLLGPNRARYFLLMGQEIHASQALQLGLISEVLPRERLLPRAHEIAELLMRQPRLVRRYTRVAITQSLRTQMSAELLGYGLAVEGLARMIDTKN